ncbi:hypothetical protein KC318_g67 [Hortaea werneckii]|nr:hypothetical protein KC355_g66 [Hortaea werneckii]KAI7676792.1 hypothetical protein KC318_g67 [Hortaea werneckii]
MLHWKNEVGGLVAVLATSMGIHHGQVCLNRLNVRYRTGRLRTKSFLFPKRRTAAAADDGMGRWSRHAAAKGIWQSVSSHSHRLVVVLLVISQPAIAVEADEEVFMVLLLLLVLVVIHDGSDSVDERCLLIGQAVTTATKSVSDRGKRRV